MRKSAKSTPVSCPEKTKLPLNWAMGCTLTWSKCVSPPNFSVVGSEHFGKSVGCLIGIVGLGQLVRRSARGITIEVKILDALALGIERHDARSAIGIGETLRDETDADATDGLTKVRVVTV